jgi:hypothetical protein
VNKTIIYSVYCVNGVQNVEEVKKHFTVAKPVIVRLCMCVRVCAGWAAVPMRTPARTISIKQNLPQESDSHPARQQISISM